MVKYCWLILILLSGCNTKLELIEYQEEHPRINQLLDTSKYLIEKELFNQAWLHLDTAEKLALEINDSLSLSSVWNNYGQIHEKKGQFQEGLVFYEKALEIDEEIKDSLRIGRRLKNIGICYRQLGLHERSLNLFLRALTIFKTQSDISQIASLENSIGNLYNTLEEFENSKPHFTRAYKLWTDTMDYRRSLIAENNLANALLGQDSVSKAIELYGIVLKKKKELGHQYSTSITLNNLGEALLKNDQIERAKENFEEALQIRELIDNPKGVATVSNNLAALYLTQNDIQMAEYFVSKAINSLRDLALNEEFVKGLSIQRSIQIKKKEFLKALNTDRVIDSLRIVLFEDQKIKVINLMSSYENNALETKRVKAERETRLQNRINRQQKVIISVIAVVLILSIILLVSIFRSRQEQRKQNTSLSVKNKEIANLSKRLALLLDDSKHRKLNDFNRLLAITDFISEKNPEIKSLLGPVHHIITTTFDLDDFLEVGGRSVSVNFSDHLKALITRLQRKYDTESLGLQVQIDCDTIIIDQKIAIGLSYIICELFNNTVKYGIPKSKKPLIILKLQQNANEIYFEYQDNGDDPEFEQKLKQSEGQGWEILLRFARSIDATMLSERLNSFSIFRFKLKIQYHENIDY